MECLGCGTCCVAPDIAALNKGIGEPCLFLDANQRCTRYDSRPQVCRGYRPDEICLLIAAPTLAERVDRYLSLFELD